VEGEDGEDEEEEEEGEHGQTGLEEGRSRPDWLATVL